MPLSGPEWSTVDTLYALDSFSDYLSEDERLIHKAAEEEEKAAAQSGAHRPRMNSESFTWSAANARYLHDEIMAPMRSNSTNCKHQRWSWCSQATCSTHLCYLHTQVFEQ
jgi:hypothetical protein